MKKISNKSPFSLAALKIKKEMEPAGHSSVANEDARKRMAMP